MNAKKSFLERELIWVRIQRRTRRPEELPLVAPAAEREQAILDEIAAIDATEAPLFAPAIGPARELAHA